MTCIAKWINSKSEFNTVKSTIASVCEETKKKKIMEAERRRKTEKQKTETTAMKNLKSRVNIHMGPVIQKIGSQLVTQKTHSLICKMSFYFLCSTTFATTF